MRTVSQRNIDAATKIRARLTSWAGADEALGQVGEQFPSNTDRVHVLLKASAIDKLYSTRAGNIYWVTEAVVAALREVRLDMTGTSDSAAVVDLFSHHKRRLYPGSNRCASFASKYCHFFVDGWEFPIYDGFALAAVNDALGRPQTGLTPGRSEYRDFCERVERLRDRDGLDDVSVRDMDRFLWLWGQWLAQDGNAEPVVNREVHGVFASQDPSLRRLVAELSLGASVNDKRQAAPGRR